MAVSAFEDRRRARAAWPMRRVDLRAETLTDSRYRASIEERTALVWELTREAWALTGKPMPTYDRSEMPGTIIRRDR